MAEDLNKALWLGAAVLGGFTVAEWGGAAKGRRDPMPDGATWTKIRPIRDSRKVTAYRWESAEGPVYETFKSSPGPHWTVWAWPNRTAYTKMGAWRGTRLPEEFPSRKRAVEAARKHYYATTKGWGHRVTLPSTVTFSPISFGRIKASINGRVVAHITQQSVGVEGAEVPHILDYDVVSYTALMLDSGEARTFSFSEWAPPRPLGVGVGIIAREWILSRLSLDTPPELSEISGVRARKAPRSQMRGATGHRATTPWAAGEARSWRKWADRRPATQLPPPIPGMEGPFEYGSGHVLYWDAKEGAYYDRGRDMYLEDDEVESIMLRQGRGARGYAFKSIKAGDYRAATSLQLANNMIFNIKRASSPAEIQHALEQIKYAQASRVITARHAKKVLASLPESVGYRA